ncbi:FkbM family methyltransferase [Candidatus Pelagibacter sp.]|nr:FkbM family methyltransferase [Candidatus Pelagibacter sp.]
MRNLIKFCLSLFDYLTEKKIIDQLKRVFSNEKTISLIDIGAHKGEYVSSIIKNFNINNVYCLEPNFKVFKILENNVSSNEKIKLFNFGASNNSGNILFNENIETSSSSINELNKNSNYYKKKFFLLNFLGLNEVTKQIEIKVVTLSDFFEENNINKIDLLKIDTEGHEFQVLSGLKDKMHMINLIHIEHHFDDMIIKDYKLTDIHNLLIKNGFKKHFKIKMKFRKSFEYLYINRNYIS